MKKNIFGLKKVFENFYTSQKETRQINKIARWGTLVVCLGGFGLMIVFQNCKEASIWSESEEDPSFTHMPSEQDTAEVPNAESLGIVQDQWASTAPVRSSASLPQQAVSGNLRDPDNLENPNNQQNLKSLQIRLPYQGVDEHASRGAIGGVISGHVPLEPIAEVVSSQPTSNQIRRLRSPTLSSDRLVVVAENSSGEEIDYQVLPNPFTIQFEIFDPDGTVSDVFVEKYPNPEIQMSAPAAAKSLIFYQPVQHAGQSILVPVARVEVD